MALTQQASADVSDSALMSAAQQGDYEAFERLVERYRDRVFRLAYGMTKSQSDAEEVVQEAFLNLFKSLSRFRGDSAPGSWIYRIAANAALMRLRQQRRKPLLSIEDYQPNLRQVAKDSIWPSGLWSRAPDKSVLSDELRHHIEAAVHKLPEKHRLVLLLRDVEGQSNAEVAEALSLTVATVKARLHRARMFVRAELERYFCGEK